MKSEEKFEFRKQKRKGEKQPVWTKRRVGPAGPVDRAEKQPTSKLQEKTGLRDIWYFRYLGCFVGQIMTRSGGGLLFTLPACLGKNMCFCLKMHVSAQELILNREKQTTVVRMRSGKKNAMFGVAFLN